MSLKRVKVALAAGATMASLAVVSVTGSSIGASGASSVNWSTVQTLAKGGPTSMSALVAAAKKEGTLNVIALPPNWANYGALISSWLEPLGFSEFTLIPYFFENVEIIAP